MKREETEYLDESIDLIAMTECLIDGMQRDGQSAGRPPWAGMLLTLERVRRNLQTVRSARANEQAGGDRPRNEQAAARPAPGAQPAGQPRNRRDEPAEETVARGQQRPPASSTLAGRIQMAPTASADSTARGGVTREIRRPDGSEQDGEALAPG